MLIIPHERLANLTRDSKHPQSKYLAREVAVNFELFFRLTGNHAQFPSTGWACDAGHYGCLQISWTYERGYDRRWSPWPRWSLSCLMDIHCSLSTTDSAYEC